MNLVMAEVNLLLPFLSLSCGLFLCLICAVRLLRLFIVWSDLLYAFIFISQPFRICLVVCVVFCCCCFGWFCLLGVCLFCVCGFLMCGLIYFSRYANILYILFAGNPWPSAEPWLLGARLAGLISFCTTITNGHLKLPEACRGFLLPPDHICEQHINQHSQSRFIA